MTHDDIIRMAWEASGGILSYDAEGEWRLSEKEVERFAALVAAHEREACAKVCQELHLANEKTAASPEAEPMYPFDCDDCAAAIRARGEE